MLNSSSSGAAGSGWAPPWRPGTVVHQAAALFDRAPFGGLDRCPDVLRWQCRATAVDLQLGRHRDLEAEQVDPVPLDLAHLLDAGDQVRRRQGAPVADLEVLPDHSGEQREPGVAVLALFGDLQQGRVCLGRPALVDPRGDRVPGEQATAAAHAQGHRVPGQVLADLAQRVVLGIQLVCAHDEVGPVVGILDVLIGAHGSPPRG